MKCWYLAYCRPKEEARAKTHLANQGVDSYYPLVIAKKIIRGKITEKLEPLFPRYLFVHADLDEFSPVKFKSTRGISSVVGHGAHWQTVPAELIDDLMRHEDCDEQREVMNCLPKCGDPVIIKSGSFKGLQAIYQEPDGTQRAILLLNMLHQDIRKSFDNSEFNRIA